MTTPSSRDLGNFVEPMPDLDAYHCTFASCATYTQQQEMTVGFNLQTLGLTWQARRCQRCFRPTLWVAEEGTESDWRLVYPPRLSGQPAHPDMPYQILKVYQEAQSVAELSPRSAAGLLRLALQMLVDELLPGPGALDNKIGKLVAQGLDPRIQRAMDVLRVIGNNAVHPGQINLDEDASIVRSLFGLLNLVIEQMISRPKHIDSLFEILPEGALQGIERRNLRAVEAS